MAEQLDLGVLGARVTRREFLVASLAGAAAVACSGNGGDNVSGSTTTRPRRLAFDAPFTLGVASGDPRAEAVVLWTRLAPRPLEGGGMPDEPVDVEWEIALDDAFNRVARRGVATAEPGFAHSLHVDATGLEPATAYFYRFRAGDETSPVGRTRTLPAADSSPERVRFIAATCQDYQGHYYAAWRHAAAEEADFVLFLGDYIYEFPGPENPAPGERVHVGGEPTTLDDYRTRYALYRTDVELQAAHARFPWLSMWDDHEVDNNYAADVSQDQEPVDAFRERRAAAYRAWWEHMPVRVEAPEDASVRIYQDLAFGDLARLFVIDERQYGDPPPCRDTSTRDFGPGCAERDDPARSRLGSEQTQWLFDGLADSTSAWNLIGSGVMFASLDTGKDADPPSYFLDLWDGYPAERGRIIDHLVDARVANPVVVSGDYHASFVNDVAREPAGAAVATEFVTPAISSSIFGEDYTARNPHVKYFEGRNGYMLCELDRERVRGSFRYVGDTTDPRSALEQGPVWEVASGTAGARQV
jgi:alkaline phosphatase D